ncbi:MAG: glycosyltransferase family 4 protein [bacterium]
MDSTPADSIHIVRRYGKVGGMERYVWELTHSLARAGHQVRVVCCEQSHDIELEQSALDRIQVYPTGQIGPVKPRWIYQLRFRRRADRLLSKINTRDWAIHSHERSLNHDVTTFHSASVRSKNASLLDFVSPRDRTWRKLELMELTAPSVRKIFPVSHLLRDTLAEHYPECRNNLEAPAYPGVGPEFNQFVRTDDRKTVGFIGVEWQRKGLDTLVRAISALRAKNQGVRLVVAGCDIASIRHLFQDWKDGYELLGWIDAPDFYKQISLLALPAQVEPFGMVAAEANACGLPVVVSTQCGIAPLIHNDIGSVVEAGDVAALTSACELELSRTDVPTALGLDWSTLATQYASAYSEVIAQKNNDRQG